MPTPHTPGRIQAAFLEGLMIEGPNCALDSPSLLSHQKGLAHSRRTMYKNGAVFAARETIPPLVSVANSVSPPPPPRFKPPTPPSLPSRIASRSRSIVIIPPTIGVNESW